jgi:hypothetical protein
LFSAEFYSIFYIKETNNYNAVLGKNTTAGSPRASDRGLLENRTSGQEIEVDAMEEGEINDEAGKEVMEDMDYAKLKNKIFKPKKRIAGKGGLELSSEEELMAQLEL